MKQQIMTEPGKIIFNDVPVPEPGSGEVLIKIEKIGVCGSDIHVNHGKHPYTSYPVTQGHEVSGVIEKVGGDVEKFKQGEKVTIQPQVVCGKCYPCTHGDYHICDELKVMGFQTTGMASEYFLVNEKHVLKLPDSMSLDQGAMVEPMAVAVHSLGRAKSIGKNVIVFGAGPIGNLIAQTAKAMGAEKVMITDLSDYRLELAKECGIDLCINPSKQDISEEILNAFGSDKADLILECVGVNATMDQAINNARKGSEIIVVGVFGDKALVDLGLVQDRELKLIGTLMYQEADYLKAIELISSGKVDLNPLITDYFSFSEYEKAYQFIDEKKDRTMKVIINVQE